MIYNNSSLQFVNVEYHTNKFISLSYESDHLYDQIKKFQNVWQPPNERNTYLAKQRRLHIRYNMVNKLVSMHYYHIPF